PAPRQVGLAAARARPERSERSATAAISRRAAQPAALCSASRSCSRFSGARTAPDERCVANCSTALEDPDAAPAVLGARSPGRHAVLTDGPPPRHPSSSHQRSRCVAAQRPVRGRLREGRPRDHLASRPIASLGGRQGDAGHRDWPRHLHGYRGVLRADLDLDGLPDLGRGDPLRRAPAPSTARPDGAAGLGGRGRRCQLAAVAAGSARRSDGPPRLAVVTSASAAQRPDERRTEGPTTANASMSTRRHFAERVRRWVDQVLGHDHACGHAAAHNRRSRGLVGGLRRRGARGRGHP
ncbi:hypothetical protein ACRAWF_20520, partial [Streptomyces sp. L7]